MYCPNCGNKARENAKFCPKCGAEIPKLKDHEIIEKPSQKVVSAEPVKAQVIETAIQTKPKASKTVVFMIIGVIVAFVVTVGSLSYVLFATSPEYKEADSLMKAGLYSEAAAAFTTLDSEYKDVEEKLAECNAMISYQQATDLMNSGSYSEAASIFIALGDFKDSTQLLQTCSNKKTYQDALVYMDSGDYETAKIKLTALGDFEDSNTLLQECEKGIQYNQAAALLQKGECEQAKAVFLSLGNFKDSAQMADNCNQSAAYERAKALYDKGEYESAKTAFTILGDYADSKSMSIKCQNYIDYNKAIGLMKSGDKASAEKIFTSLESFKDSKELALDCKYSGDYENAKILMGQGNYPEAAKLLETPASFNYKDSKALLSDCKKGPAPSSQNNEANDSADKSTYDQAVAAYNAGNFYTAYKLFGTITKYRDSINYLNSCIQTAPSSGVMYHNNSYTQNECLLYIDATDLKNYYIKILSGSTLVYELFYSNGTSTSLPLKKGTYTIKFSYAKSDAYNNGYWFGIKEKFGDEGQYYVALVESSENIEIQNSFLLPIGGTYKILSITRGKPEINKKIISRSSF